MIKAFFTSIFLFLQFVVFAQESFVQGELLAMLHYRQNTAALTETLNQQHPGLNLELKATLSQDINVHLFRFNPALFSNAQALEILLSSKAVAIAQYNHDNITPRDTCPNDPLFVYQWHLFNNGSNGGAGTNDMDACQAWDVTTGGYTKRNDRIVVAVVDGGFDTSHNDISYFHNVLEIPGNGIDDDLNGYIDDHLGWNAISNNNNVYTTSDPHATHVSGIIGAKGNSNNLVSGINWDVNILPVKGSTNSESVAIAGYGYVLKMRRLYNQTNGAKGAFIVATNSSFGIDNASPAAYPLWCAMYDSLGVEGIISVAATSNSNINVDVNGDIPTACGSNYLITVTNTTSSDLKATAGYGASSIDLGAPGTSIYSTILNNASGSLTGTSMASPQVAGAIALMWAAACEEMVDDYKLDPDGVALIMRNFLLTQGWDAIAALDGITVTGGRLNLDKAVHAVAAYANCPVGISESAHNDLINVYPNPSNGYFTLVSSAEAKPISVEVYSMMGQLVGFSSLQQLENDNYQLNLSHLPQGFYSLRILLNQNTYTFVQVIVSH
jgi:hypothetical protein